MLDHDTDAYYKISSAFVDGRPSGNLTRDHILDNVTTYWLTCDRSLGGPLVLGGRTSRGCRCGDREGPSACVGPGRIHHVPRRDLADPAQLGRAGLPDPRLFQRGRQGRPLRRLGRAGPYRNRDPRRVPTAALGESTAQNAEVDMSAAARVDANRPGARGSWRSFPGGPAVRRRCDPGSG